MSSEQIQAWGISDGSAGMVAQLRGLLEALELPYELKRCVRKKPQVWLPNTFAGDVWSQLTPDSDSLKAPWPKLVITCGRRSAPLGLAVKDASGGATKAVHIGNPQGKNDRYDLIVAMLHDRLYGTNVIDTQFSLHRITSELLRREREYYLPRMRGRLKPLVAILIGGSTNKYRFGKKAMLEIFDMIEMLLGHSSASLLVSTSRRTGEANEAMLEKRYGGYKRIWIAEKGDANPYLGFLASADFIIVTNDSVNMMSEAAATGKPIFIFDLPGHENTKPASFAHMLLESGVARRLEVPFPEWTYPSCNETDKVVAKIRERLAM